jgi:hypothetical protein
MHWWLFHGGGRGTQKLPSVNHRKIPGIRLVHLKQKGLEELASAHHLRRIPANKLAGSKLDGLISLSVVLCTSSTALDLCQKSVRWKSIPSADF